MEEGQKCPPKHTIEWKVLLHNLDNNEQDATESWRRNNEIVPTGTKLLSEIGWYKEARELRKLSVDELAEFIVSHTKESFSQKKISNSYWMKEFGDLGRATQKINKVNLQVRKELFKLHPIPGKYHKKSGNQMRILKTTDGRSIFKQISNKKQYQVVNQEGQVASEKTIRDLAARMSDRIGVPIKFESDRTKEYKGKIENNTAYVNLAYATLDTPIHEILGHPIIRAIKNIDGNTLIDKSKRFSDEYFDYFKKLQTEGKTVKEAEELSNKKFDVKPNTLYQNLLKELETGKGKEVLDRIKRDYNLKNKPEIITMESITGIGVDFEVNGKSFGTKAEAIKEQEKATTYYSLEEQQEEAIVELLGMMTAEKLDNVKDGKLISLLKRLLKEMKQFVRSLINQREVEIDKLPDNMTLGDIADLLAYSNSKLILPGYEVEYTTPDNMKFKTYQEASNHISKLVTNAQDVDLNDIELIPILPKGFKYNGKVIKSVAHYLRTHDSFSPDDNQWEPSEPETGIIKYENGTIEEFYEENIPDFIRKYGSNNNHISSFVSKNKEYEQSKEIIEEWKRVNNIQYNPEEIYSRGQEFSSVVGAYSSFDVNLMMQNLLSHIEDNEKAGGKFAISAYTKPVDRQIGHLEGGGGKIKFKLYPQSNDILWAANTDVYSGSVWDASAKVNKDKKSELLGVSYTKYPSLLDVSSVKPNLAAIVDELSHHHNELGIALTGNNFRLEYDENIPHQTKKIIDGINSILDQKYGKLVKPKIKAEKIEKSKEDKINEALEYFNKLTDSEKWDILFDASNYFKLDDPMKTTNNQIGQYLIESKKFFVKEIIKSTQPTQTNETLKESINDVKNRLDDRSNLLPTKFLTKGEEEGYSKDTWFYKENGEWHMKYVPYDAPFDTKVENYDIIKLSHAGLSIEEVWASYLKTKPEGIENLQINNKEYTSQALINTKIAKLKEVAKKYPRSLIRSEVTPIKNTTELFIDDDDLPFQKVPSTEEEFLPQDPKIESAVKGIMSQLGIRLEAYDEYAQWYEMTYGKPLHAVGIADMLRGVIAIDKGRADKYTSLEELSHFVLYALKDDKRVIDALSVIESTTEWKNHSEAYIEEYDGDMEMVRLEILGKILKKRLGDEILDERPIWKRRLELIWNAFLQFFKKSNPAKELRIENALNDIVNQVMRGDTGQIKEGIQEGKGIFMQRPSSKKAKKPKDDKYEEFRKKFENSKLLNALGNELDSSMKLIYNRVQDVKRQGIESLIEREQKIYGEMLEAYNNKRVTSGIVKYIAHVEEGSDHILKEINRLRNDYAAGELDGDTIGFIEVLRDMNRYISMYEDSIVSLTTQVAIHKATIDREGNPSEQVDLIMRSLQNIRSGMDAMQQTYKDYAGILLLDHAKGLIMKDPFFRTEEERNAKLADIEANIKSTHNDMSISMWVNSAAESADDIIGLMDRTHKNAEGAANLQTEDDAKTIINFHEVARENGMLNTEWMYELDENGVPTGNYISEINASKVEKTINEFFTNLRKRFELTPDPEIDDIEERKKELKLAIQEIESGKRKPEIAADADTKVTNAKEYFHGNIKKTKVRDKKAALEFFKNKLAYLESKGTDAYTKYDAHNQRVLERSSMSKKKLLDYNTAIAKFFTENFEENPKWQSILEQKETAIYNRIFTLKKDRERIKHFKTTYGNKWIAKLIKQDIALAPKVKRAETLLSDWKSERMVETILGNKTVISYRREFAKPKVSKFGNDTFANLMKDPVRKAYYDAWVAMRDKKVSHMSAEYRNSTLMPQIRKDDLERMKTNPSQVLSQMVKDAFTVRADETERGVLGLDANGRKIQQVPLFFMRKLEDMGELSLDATASMIAFADTANRHSALSAIIDVSEMTADILRVRKIKKEGSEEVITEGGNPYRMYREVMDMRLYGEWKKEELLGTVDMGKVADALNRYSALSTLALNAFAGFNNVILGNSLIRQESFANQHVGIDDVMYADKVYWDPKEGVPNLMQDIGKLRTENKLRLFIERFDLLQDHDNRMSRVNADRGRFGRMFTLSALFFINHMGEHQMQSRLGVALAHKLKVLNDKGEQIPLYEAFDVEDHKLKLKDGIRNLDGSDFTNEDITAFSIRAASINQSLHGIYNSADKAIYQRYAMGRIVGLYRKWMMPGINRRWKGRYHNWSMETDVEGFYRTASKFIYQLFKELREGQFTMASAKDRYSKLHDFEKANLARALGEVAMMMIALVAGILLERLADSIDDDDEIAAWGANMAAYQANRYFTEMAFYLPLLGTLEQLKIINSPAAAVNQISHIMSIGKIIDPTGWLIDDEDFIPRYERGRHKGDLKAYIWARDMFPVVSTVEDWFYPEDRLKYFID